MADEMKVELNKKTARCYKFDEPCFGCTPEMILKQQLTVEEVEGYEAVVSGEGMSRPGFICKSCVQSLEEEGIPVENNCEDSGD